MSDEIRDQINDIIEGEIQNNINEYLESQNGKEESGVGFVGDQAKELKVNVSNEEIDKIIKKYKKIQKYRKSNLFQASQLVDKNGKQL